MDTVAQMLTVVRNGALAKLDKVDMPASKIRENLAKILVSQGYARSYKVARDSKQGIMRIYLKYDEKGNSALTHIQKVSKPGKRVYVQAGQIPVVRSGTGQCIISTNKGIVTGGEAQKLKVGGEILCVIW